MSAKKVEQCECKERFRRFSATEMFWVCKACGREWKEAYETED